MSGIRRVLNALGPVMLAAALLWSIPAADALEGDGFDDPQVQRRYEALLREYTCPDCRNETLADTTQPAMLNVRREIRIMLANGATDAEVHDYVASAFAGRALRRRGNLLLWGIAAALAAASAGFGIATVKRRVVTIAPESDGGASSLARRD